MDAHIFRRIAAELAPLIRGARVSKIYSLSETALLLVLDAPGECGVQKLYLNISHKRDTPALFLTPAKPLTPPEPDAQTMRLRKYVQGKHIRNVHSLWEHRTLALDFSNPSGTEPLLLLLNLAPPPGRAAALLHFGPVPDFEVEPEWPPAGELTEILADAESYKRFPVLTPLLRKTLPLLDDRERAALLADLQSGQGDIFVYEQRTPAGCGQPRSGASENHALRAASPECRTGSATEGYAIEARATPEIAPAPLLSAWPLPAPLCGGRAELIFTLETDARPALAAAARCFAGRIMDAVHDADRARTHAEDSRERKRAARLAAKLDEEERKLHAWIDAQTDAVLLQTWLHSLPKDLKTDAVTLEGEGGPRRINLDPLLTISENMERLVRLAAKGKRGLGHLESRRRELADRGSGVHNGLSPLRSPLPRTPPPPLTLMEGDKAREGRNPRVGATRPEARTGHRNDGHALKDISQFHSSGGFVILRGKNAQGNRALLKLAAPHDLWLHSQNGPSAHTLLRRAHALIDVPDADLAEAAALTALKSAWKDDTRAEIMVALARDVRPVKGGAPGQVLVDKIWRTLVVRPDAELETRLAGK